MFSESFNLLNYTVLQIEQFVAFRKDPLNVWYVQLYLFACEVQIPGAEVDKPDFTEQSDLSKKAFYEQF